MSDGDLTQRQFQDALAAQQQGDLETADRCYRQVLAAAPRNSPACNNLGITLAMRGRVAEAMGFFRQALDADTNSVDACVNLAQACQQLGHHDDALETWARAMDLLPEAMEPALSAGLLCLELGRLDDGCALLEAAARRTPRKPGTRALLLDRLGALASTRIGAGAPGEGHRLAALLLELDPDDEAAARMVAHCLRLAEPRRFAPGVKRDLLRCFASDAVDHRELARVSARLLVLEHDALSVRGSPCEVLDAVCGAGVHQDPLLLALLWRSVNADPFLETTLTALRQGLLERIAGAGNLDDPQQVLLGALAAQCFSNEYVFAVSEQEQSQVQALRDRLGAAGSGQPFDPVVFAAICAYQAPWRLPGAAALAQAAEGAQQQPWLSELVLRSLLEPLTEQSLRAHFAPASISDTVSRDVMRHYEESPYPRWLTLERQVPESVADHLAGALPGWTPPAGFDAPVRMLIAGCGTGEHALRVAARHPWCHVDAIDLSAASLAYAARKQRELGIENLSLRQADILGLQSGEGPYPIIESVGVLHHMDDPGAGLGILTDLLDTDGILKLGLYSAPARQQVNRARERIRELRLSATPGDMRTFRQQVLDGRAPDLEGLCGSLDFYTMSTVRDLLFHVQEHQFDVPALAALLGRCGLAVIGFLVPPATRRRYLERFPDDPRLANLDHWHAFEQDHPDTFAGMYQFYCQRGGG